jgi:hypothetical protein
MNKDLAPILLFVYNRFNCLKSVLEALKTCELASDSDLYVFSDGPKSENNVNQVKKVREYIRSISGFKSVYVTNSEKNQGLANSIIHGVTTILEKKGKVIVLEDDILVSKNFLVYMNSALNRYEDNSEVFSIAGYSLPLKLDILYLNDVYFIPRASSWGWATWQDRWKEIDWETKDFISFRRDKKSIAEFNKGGSDLFDMLNRQIKGEIDSWAIRWCYHQFKVKGMTAFPVISKVQNIGFSKEASNTVGFNRNYTKLDSGQKREFNFPTFVYPNEYYLEQFQNFYSLKSRALGRLNSVLHMAGLKKNK